MHRLHRLSDRLNAGVIFLCAALFLAMLSITFTGALWQAITGDALSWTYSLARQFVPWIGCLSITVAFKSGEHVAVDLLRPRLPHAGRRLIEAIIVISIALFAALTIYEGIRFFLEARQLVMISDQIQISQRWTVASVPAMGAIMLVHSACGTRLLDDNAVTPAEEALV